jgi:peptidoglycan hydrolase-like protein with peptidoglycan-binding domain
MDPAGILEFGKTNKADQVILLQKFLNQEMNSNLTITGIYDEATLKAVISFQAKYQADILSPWGLSTPTGVVYYSTINKINRIMCPIFAPTFDSKYLVPISRVKYILF